ncbi:MAG: ribose-phosphate pyrophosphokinase [Defluviitaleaceae bacterium]|nr:ribose-phosphate pyrophosphokinase [Defluviitaleaceae bacterium]
MLLRAFGDMKIFAASANPQLAQDVVKYLGIELGNSEAKKFSDGEINMRINEPVRGADVFIIQSTGPPVNDNLMELLIMIDAMRRSSAGRITAVVPYFGYARQDRRAQPHDPISAKLVADMIAAAGADRILSIDLHCPQIQGFFNIPMDHILGVYKFAHYYTSRSGNLSDVVIVAPDLGSVSRCNALAEMLDLPLAIVDKRRHNDTQTEVANFIGDVRGKHALLVDDVLSTGGSLCSAARTVMEHGAEDVYACVTHPVLSGDAIKTIEDSPLTEVVVLNTLEIPPEKRHPKINVLSIAEYVGESIRRIHNSQSLGELFRAYGFDRREG